MFDFLKSKGTPPSDVKEIRQQLLLFIKEQLRKAEGGEGASIKGLQLFIDAGAEAHLYEAAVYYNEPNRFAREEVQRIADDYAIDLPEGWNLDIVFTGELPTGAAKAPNMPAALGIVTRHHSAVQTPETAMLRVLNGEAEQEIYEITPASGRVCIGRDKKAQADDGFLRENDIAFPSNSKNEGNKYVSRQHAHIEWDKHNRCFCLYADEGGIPPRNKVKVQRENGATIRLQTTEIGHKLEPGDKIVLGTSVLLEFDYISPEED
jgi:hypothetical protein